MRISSLGRDFAGKDLVERIRHFAGDLVRIFLYALGTARSGGAFGDCR